MPTSKELEGLYQKDKDAHSMTPVLKTTGWYVWFVDTKRSSSAMYFDFTSHDVYWDDCGDSNDCRVFAVRSRKDKATE